MRVRLGKKRVRVRDSMAIGKGGEADVFALPGGLALKLFKQPDHPDLRALPVEQAAAQARIREHQDKLPAFPAGLPARVVTPVELAREDRRGGAIIGYAMRRVEGAESLHAICDPKVRRAPGMAERALRVARDLHTTLERLHRHGVVIGDFNDLNILVKGDAAHVIDADSFQYGKWRCGVYTERFVDPLLCDPAQTVPVLTQPHTRDSDWYAFAILVMRLLLCVGPYGGVHKPASGSRIPHAARPLHRVTLFRPDVVPPRPAISHAVLPERFVRHLRDVFERDRRGPFPRVLLDDLRFRTCTSCGLEHARSRCPGCRHRVAPPPPVCVRGAVTATQVAPLPPAAPHRNRSHRYWIEAGALMRCGPHGSVRMGNVLGRARMWVGEAWGIGYYRAGRLTVGFAFDAERPGLNDQIRLPAMAGNVVEAHAVVGDELAWLFILEQVAGRRSWHCLAVTRRGEVIARDTAEDRPDGWHGCARGAVAVGRALLVPTDDGIVRVEIDDGVPSITRRFPDTAPFVDSGTQLAITDSGLVASTPDRAVSLSIQ